MTSHYARLTYRTIRQQWERARKVDSSGRDITAQVDGPHADADWMQHNLARAKMALPNGYCGLPLQQSCPHANWPRGKRATTPTTCSGGRSSGVPGLHQCSRS